VVAVAVVAAAAAAAVTSWTDTESVISEVSDESGSGKLLLVLT